MSGLELRSIYGLRCPSVWARVPVLEAALSVAGSAAVWSLPARSLDPCLAKTLSAVPRSAGGVRLWEALCQENGPDISVAELTVRLTLVVQTIAGPPVSFGRALATAEADVYRVIIECDEEYLGRACLAVATSWSSALVDNRSYDLAPEVSRLREVADDVCLGPSTRAVVQAARARGIPTRRLNTASLIQFGQGIHQRRFCAGETDRTSVLAESIACDKQLTRQLLHAAGVPVPEGRLVADAEDAWRAACELSGPAVVKPLNGNHGRAVFLGLTNCEEITAAYEKAQDEGDGVLVERFISGCEHRLLVVGEQVVAATRGDPVYVVGDGQHTVLELVEELNRDPRRGEDAECPLMPVDLDSPNRAALAHQGYQPDSIPPADERVLVQRNGNLSVDVTDEVHPAVARAAVLAARTVGLDIAGVDVVVEHIGQPLLAQGGAVVEVNAGPGMQMHMQPAVGVPRPVGERIADLLFPDGADGRIPIVAVAGGRHRTHVARLVSHLLSTAGIRTGLACAAGTFVDDQRLRGVDAANAGGADTLLMHPRIEAAVIETPEANILREGLAVDGCRVAVVVAGDSAEAGAPGVVPPDDLQAARRVLLAAVVPGGSAILDATLPTVAELPSQGVGDVILFANQPTNPALRAHRERGGKAVFLRDTAVVACEGGREEVLARRVTLAMLQPAATSWLLAAVAAAWALRLSATAIQHGLDTFVFESA